MRALVQSGSNPLCPLKSDTRNRTKESCPLPGRGPKKIKHFFAFRAFARELIDLKPDLIIGITTPAVAALVQETNTIPILFVNIVDSVDFSPDCGNDLKSNIQVSQC